MSHHEQVVDRVRSIGRRLGFAAEAEQSVEKNIARDAYRPRLDVAWAIDLKAGGFDLRDVAALTQNPRASLYGAVGAEVEVSHPSTKRHFSNLANLALARLAFSMLVVDVTTGENDMYRRANRAVRAFNYRYGVRDAVAIDVGQLDGVMRDVSSHEALRPPRPRVVGNGGVGGESFQTRALRQLLVERGLLGGFVVLQDTTDARMDAEFRAIAALAPNALDIPWVPGVTRRAASASSFWTASRPDVVWAIETGQGFKQFVNAVASATVGGSLYSRFGPVPEFLPVVSFELERSGGKHAAGAVFTLAAQPGVGVVVASRQEQLSAMHDSHGQVIGTGHVLVVSEDSLVQLLST